MLATYDNTSIHYHVFPYDVEGHRYRIELTCDASSSGKTEVYLPVWIPGSYLIREFSRSINSIQAHAIIASVDTPITIQKMAKNKWLVESAPNQKICIIIDVYAYDTSVRSAFLDATRGFINGTSLYLALRGREHEPLFITIHKPSSILQHSSQSFSSWKLHTTLTAQNIDTQGFGTYTAHNYDEAIDHPIEMGTPFETSFQVQNVIHDMVFAHVQSFDHERLTKDLTAICSQHAKMFGSVPMKRYLFMTAAYTDAYGGLEHRDSTILVCKRDDLPKKHVSSMTDGYRQFLGLASHEYFHLWNVKRIKPAAFTPYNLENENHTTLLWAFEGITSYYDDLALVRSGVITIESYLELLGRAWTKLQRTRGRSVQTLADSSYDTWVKYYRQDENSPNNQVNYYIKGSLVALLLDLTIRTTTQHTRSLDDVMRLLWTRYGQTGVGVPEDGVEAAAAEIAGTDLKDFFDLTIRSTKELEPVALLQAFGIEWLSRPSENDQDQGGKASSKALDVLQQKAFLGFTLGSDGVTLSTVALDSPAHHAGLAAGDVLVALNGMRATKTLVQQALQDQIIGQPVEYTYFRRDYLYQTTLRSTSPLSDTVYLTLSKQVSESVLSAQQKWLGAL